LSNDWYYVEFYEYYDFRLPRLGKSLTAVVLIRVVHTVLHAVTSEFAGDALALLASELVWAAGTST